MSEMVSITKGDNETYEALVQILLSESMRYFPEFDPKVEAVDVLKAIIADRDNRRAASPWTRIDSVEDRPQVDGHYWMTETPSPGVFLVEDYERKDGIWGFTDPDNGEFYTVSGGNWIAWQPYYKQEA